MVNKNVRIIYYRLMMLKVIAADHDNSNKSTIYNVLNGLNNMI